ncbi:DUF3857 domain-containing protein [Flavobacterium silvaticum]|uniref:DUF3857 domain-containing transglutaminase family protein n=1 Tax=Flavobacterium silvaticum TaxID=1852020 RepID=A0A972FSL6_9FLAO|nr:DUF3857 domain-containing transglutaminase family protein [Flavobacterium silvaticum]NMH27247.1 DUF3857 domain-containing transglutaminase family protein [Flavobacterium silvaticum]
MKSRYLFILLLLGFGLYAQIPAYSVLSIPDSLKQNANLVIRKDDTKIAITSQRDMTINRIVATTVLNETGLRSLDLSEYYQKTRKITAIQARVFDAFGKEIKIFKRRDFRDTSVGDGFSVFNDDRVLSLDYTPIGYPFTVVFESEVQTSNTAFLPTWSPLSGFFSSTESASIEIKSPADLGLQVKQMNFSKKISAIKTERDGYVSVSVANIKALKYEDSSPEFGQIVPMVYFRLNKFNLEGVDGQAANWKEFGKWYYESLLVGTDEVSPETQARIKQLVGTEKDPEKIARIIYKYVQEKTRYVSIQIGIGGFKPMQANDVDKLGYGDCKALSNYTRALLEVAGVPSYFTVVYANNRYRHGFLPDFASASQGNHVILAIPKANEYIWLECTNQVSPFGFQGTFTDDREVLVVKPEGGEIVRTRTMVNDTNAQLSKGNYTILPSGAFDGNLSIVSQGSQYSQTFMKERFSAVEKENYYKDYFSNIQNLKLDKVEFENDRNQVRFTQNVKLSSETYATLTGDRLMFVANAFNLNSGTPKRYRNRENAFQIERGFLDEDEIVINLPEGFSIEALPSDFELKTKFGQYNTSLIKKTETTLTYKRRLLINDGFYPKEEYDAYRLFREQIAKNDNSKIVLKKA